MRKSKLAWARWEWQDPYQGGYWTACTVSIYRPTYDYPHVSILVSMANGGGKCFMRCSSLDQAMERVVIPGKYLERLRLAETRACEEMERIKTDLRLIYDASQPGSKLVNADGEIIAEAERILRDG